MNRSIFAILLIFCGLGLCHLVIASENNPILGERIDGPANLRDTIRGNVILSIEDNVKVQCSEIKDDWYQTGIVVPLTKKQFEDWTIKKGTRVIHHGKLICTAKEDIELWMVDENNGADTSVNYVGFIGGYTYKTNIKPESIPERELEKILNSEGEFSKDKFEKYLHDFNFRNNGLDIDGYESVEQYMIYGPWIDDPSPIDRIRLIFDSNELLAVIHKRELNVKGEKSHDLVRGMQILIVKDFKAEELRNFIEKNKRSYDGVD